MLLLHSRVPLHQLFSFVLAVCGHFLLVLADFLLSELPFFLFQEHVSIRRRGQVLSRLFLFELLVFEVLSQLAGFLTLFLFHVQDSLTPLIKQRPLFFDFVLELSSLNCVEVPQSVALLEQLLKLIDHTGLLARLHSGEAGARRDNRRHFRLASLFDLLSHLLRLALLTLGPLFAVSPHRLELLVVLMQVLLYFLVLFAGELVHRTGHKLAVGLPVPFRRQQVAFRLARASLLRLLEVFPPKRNSGPLEIF